MRSHYFSLNTKLKLMTKQVPNWSEEHNKPQKKNLLYVRKTLILSHYSKFDIIICLITSLAIHFIEYMQLCVYIKFIHTNSQVSDSTLMIFSCQITIYSFQRDTSVLHNFTTILQQFTTNLNVFVPRLHGELSKWV